MIIIMCWDECMVYLLMMMINAFIGSIWNLDDMLFSMSVLLFMDVLPFRVCCKIPKFEWDFCIKIFL